MRNVTVDLSVQAEPHLVGGVTCWAEGGWIVKGAVHHCIMKTWCMKLLHVEKVLLANSTGASDKKPPRK